jgi:hypothetical protein
MKEYWEITYERGIATNAVWAMQPNFELRNLTRFQHTQNVDSLAARAQTRATAEAALSNNYGQRDDLFEKLADLIIRVPGAIEGQLTADDDLHGQLDAIYAIDPSNNFSAALRRARLVAPLWSDFNAQLAAQTPPKPAFTLQYQKPGSDDMAVAIGQAEFVTLVSDCEAALNTVAGQQRTVTNAKSALRSLESRVDRDNKRWYQAWTAQFPAGTPEGDAALSQIPTEQGTQEPNALEIASLEVHADRTVTVNYPDNGGEHATTLELLTKLPGEDDFGHTVPVVRPSQTAGPFAAGATVSFVVRVSNSTPGFVLGTPKAVVLPV